MRSMSTKMRNMENGRNASMRKESNNRSENESTTSMHHVNEKSIAERKSERMKQLEFALMDSQLSFRNLDKFGSGNSKNVFDAVLDDLK